jgi:hypothetical protein
LEALLQLGQAQPQAATAELIHFLQGVDANTQGDLSLRYSAVEALGELGLVARSQAMTSELIKFLQDVATDVKAEADVRSEAVAMLIQLGQAQGQSNTDERIDLLPILFRLTKNDLDHTSREIGPEGLFLLAIYDPSQEAIILAELEKLRFGPEPHLRMAAARALGMMEVPPLQWIKDARKNPAQAKNLKMKVDNWYEDYSIRFALWRRVQEEIEKITAAKKDKAR